MIAYLSGKIIDKRGGSIVVEASGVGYLVNVTNEQLHRSEQGSETAVWIHHVVRENQEDLYGFDKKTDLEMFELLLTISGIGPKSSLSILNTAKTETLIEGIESGDGAYLSKISGISKKNSEKIIVALKDKILSTETEKTFTYKNENAMAIDALVSLGYSEKESREAINQIIKDQKGNDTTDDKQKTEKIIRGALKKLSGN